MNEVEHLQPTVLVNNDGPALWQLADGPMALAIFSDPSRAEAYADELLDNAASADWCVKAPDPTQTVRMLAACVRSGVRVAALNPKAGQAQRLFDLTVILRDVRERIRRGESIRF